MQLTNYRMLTEIVEAFQIAASRRDKGMPDMTLRWINFLDSLECSRVTPASTLTRSSTNQRDWL